MFYTNFFAASPPDRVNFRLPSFGVYHFKLYGTLFHLYVAITSLIPHNKIIFGFTLYWTHKSIYIGQSV